MKRFIELLHIDLGNQINPKCGSSAILRLDCRNNLETQKEDGFKLMAREKEKTGFRILAGESLLNCKPIYTYIATEFKHLKMGDYC